jgi:hypothetical protein
MPARHVEVNVVLLTHYGLGLSIDAYDSACAEAGVLHRSSGAKLAEPASVLAA